MTLLHRERRQETREGGARYPPLLPKGWPRGDTRNDWKPCLYSREEGWEASEKGEADQARAGPRVWASRPAGGLGLLLGSEPGA